MKMSPTPKQKDLLDKIREHIAATGCAPSYKEMQLMIAAKSINTIFRLIHGLIERGHLSMIPGKPRSVVLL